MTDELIRAAYEKIAATAPPSERVRARLSARTRSHRQRRAVLAGAGAGALGVAAATVPIVHFARRPAAPATTTPSTASPSSTPPAAPVATVPLRYAVGWLPAGVGEQFREAASGGGTRTWLLDGLTYPTDYTVARGVTLAVNERIDDDSGSPVTVGNVTGRLRVTDAAMVEWTPRGGPTMIVTVYGLPGSTETALRVARSVRPTSSTMPVWIRAPWVPDRFRGTTAARLQPLAGGGWRQQLTCTSPDYAEALIVLAATEAPAEATLHLLRRPGGVWLWIPENPKGLIGARPLDPPTGAEAVRLLDELVCVTPGLEWVGSRV